MASMSYHITIWCPECQRMLYEKQGIGADEYQRAMEQAVDLKRNRLPQQHPGHNLTLTGNTNVIDQYVQ